MTEPLNLGGASLVAQMARYLPSVQNTWVRSLGWEGPLEEGMTTHSRFLAWSLVGYSLRGCKE